MGLSHHWRRPTELPADLFRAAAADVRKLLSSSQVELAGFDAEQTHIDFESAILIQKRVLGFTAHREHPRWCFKIEGGKSTCVCPG